MMSRLPLLLPPTLSKKYPCSRHHHPTLQPPKRPLYRISVRTSACRKLSLSFNSPSVDSYIPFRMLCSSWGATASGSFHASPLASALAAPSSTSSNTISSLNSLTLRLSFSLARSTITMPHILPSLVIGSSPTPTVDIAKTLSARLVRFRKSMSNLLDVFEMAIQSSTSSY